MLQSLLISAVCLPSIVEATRLAGAGDSHICPSCVLQEGDTHTCQGVTFTLGTPLGEGRWGAVFRTTDSKYAVKIETQTRRNDKFSHLKNYEHECGVMREFEAVDGIQVPACRAICIHEGKSVLVMDLIQTAVDMKHISQDTHGYDMRAVARQIYESATAMLAKHIVNVDQRAENIVVGSHDTVYFIDMGMASRESEVQQYCNDKETVRRYALMKQYADLGGSAGCENQIGSEASLTLTSALDSLPTSSIEAMEGLTEAFCKNPFHELTLSKYYRVSATEEDKNFLEAFKGKVNWDDTVVPPVLKKQGDVWVKVGSKPVKVTGYNGRPQPHKIPNGARLLGIKCDSSWKLEDVSQFDPVNSKWDICKGWYYFKEAKVQYVANKVLEVLGRAGPAAAHLKEEAQNCIHQSGR